MVVADLMQKKVRTIDLSDTLADAVAAMLDAELSALPVLDEYGKPVAIVTNREILAATLGGSARGGSLRNAVSSLKAVSEQKLLATRLVGRAQLLSNVLGLLFHAAEHTQRPTGQVIATCKIIRGMAREQISAFSGNASP